MRAIFTESVPGLLLPAKGLIPVGSLQTSPFVFQDSPQSPVHLYKEVTGVYITIVLHDKVLAAVLSHGAHDSLPLDQITQHRIEEPDRNPLHIGAHPLIKKQA